ncbi:thiamine phosphate synthase [Demequina sediminicola]|uniref:thiamine phosphate synthase n=1 Tax=Demequina sediminicola TaxID=1095026 RepID=UPI00078300B7|nr:thiamine phosphate synthase [Demequina sediminicola]
MSIDLSIYLVTDVSQSAGCGRDIVTTVREAVAGGATAVQIRHKDADARSLMGLTRSVAEAVPEHVAVIVNDRVDVAHAARAAGVKVDGVHLGQRDLPVADARRILGDDAIIGLSTSTPDQILAAADVDYLGIGAVRPTTSKVNPPPPLGIERACELARHCAVPAVAIGGVRADDVAELRRGGFAGAAVVSWICASPDPRAAAAMLSQVWEAAA